MKHFFKLIYIFPLAIPLILPEVQNEQFNQPTPIFELSDYSRSALYTTTNYIQHRKIDKSEKYCLAQAVYFEARSESFESQLAVAQVVLNRVNSKKFPNTVCSVVFQNENRRHKCQFSFACDGLSDKMYNVRAKNFSYGVAEIALNDTEDITGGALFFHADYVKPYWRKYLTKTVKYDKIVFFKENEK